MERLVKRYGDLNAIIQNKRAFGFDYTSEKLELKELENQFKDSILRKINDDFITANKWVNSHITPAWEWDLLIYQGIVGRIVSISRMSYNRGSDTFDYRGKVTGIFVRKEIEFEFGYYDTVPFEYAQLSVSI